MKLLVISNHNPDKWGNEQKSGWDKIEYIPFPNIKSDADMNGVADIVSPVCEKIGAWIADNPDGRINLQGEFSACYIIQQALGDEHRRLIFPTTERVVEETVRPDGTVAKTANFKFVRWR